MPIELQNTGMTARLWQAVPRLPETVAGSLVWSLLAAASAAITLVYARGFLNSDQIGALALIFGIGAALAFPVALYVTNLLTPNRSTWRFTVMLLALALVTVLATATVFALVYRDYYAQWHGPFLSRLWLWQQFFTIGGAVFQYLVVGLRLYVPIGLVALVGLSLWANRLAH